MAANFGNSELLLLPSEKRCELHVCVLELDGVVVAATKGKVEEWKVVVYCREQARMRFLAATDSGGGNYLG